MPKKTYDKQFKEDAAKYRIDHPELSNRKCADYLGVGETTLEDWVAQYKKNGGSIECVGSGNYSSEKDKEIAQLKRDLRDAYDAIDVLKKTLIIVGKK